MKIAGAGRSGRLALLTVLIGLAGTAQAQAAPPSVGLYAGSGYGGVEMAFSVVDTPKGRAVTRVGGYCGPSRDYAPWIARNADGAFTWLIGEDGRWGPTTVGIGFNNVAGGTFTGDAGTLEVPRDGELFRGCDPAAYEGAGPNPTFQVTRIGDLRTVQDGDYTAAGQGAGGDDLTTTVFGGGALIGGFNGFIAGSGSAGCDHTLSFLLGGARLGTDGTFTLGWEAGGSPRTPARGTAAGGTVSATFVTDYPPPTGCGAVTTNATFRVTRPQAAGPPLPPPGPAPGAIAPGAVPTTTCAKPAVPNRIVAGPFVLCTEAKAVVKSAVATFSGAAELNGFLYVEGGTITVDTRAGTITSDRPVEFGVVQGIFRIPVARVPLKLDAKRLKGFSLAGLKSKLNLGSLPIDLSRVGGEPPKLSIDLAAGALSLSAGLQYDIAGSTIAAAGELTYSRAGWAGSLSAEGFAVPLRIGGRQLFELKRFEVSYDGATANWTIAGKADVAIPKLATGEVDFKGSFVNGRLDSLSLAVTASGRGGLRGVPGPYGTYFNMVGLSVGNLAAGASNITVGAEIGGGWPLRTVKVIDVTFAGQGGFDLDKLVLTLMAQAHVQALELPIANGDSTLTISFGDEKVAELTTNVSIGDIITGQAHFVLSDGSFLSRDQLQLRFGPDSIPIRFIKDITPRFVPTPDSIGPLASAEALISDIGAGARTTYGAWKLKIGIAVIYRWGNGILPSVDVNLGDAKSLDGLDPGRGSRQARPRTSGAFTVTRGQQGLIVAASGSPDGRVLVKDPQGRVVIDTDGLTGPTQERAGGRVLVGRSGPSAGGIVLNPVAGRWTVTTSGGTTPFSGVRTTLVPRAGSDLARVGAVRGPKVVRPGSALRVRVIGAAGTRVQLRAARSGKAADIGVPLATVRPGLRTVRVPRDWAGTSLRVVAVTQRGGVAVGSTRAARSVRIAPVRLGRVGKVLVVRGPTSTTVRHGRATGAARYLVRITVAGRRYEKVTTSTATTLRVPTRRRTATVRVTPVARDGRLGVARTRVIR